MIESPWLYEGQPVDDVIVSGWAGFVYLITDLETGKKYIGRKYLTSKRKVKGRRKTTESDWKSYFSSSDEIKLLVEQYGPQRFKREIVAFGKTRGEVNFLEIMLQFELRVLESNDWYNGTINKWRKTNVSKYQSSIDEARKFFKNIN